MSWSTWQHCRQQLSGVEAIDYYFAREFTGQVVLADEAHKQLWFECLVVLSYLQRQGHTCLDVTQIVNSHLFVDETADQSGLTMPSAELIESVLMQGMASLRPHSGLVYESPRLFTERYWRFEQDIATSLLNRATTQGLSAAQTSAVKAIWPQMFDCSAASTADWQQVATALSLVQGLSIINGGPGTGKTYTVTRILLAQICALGTEIKIQLAAPTGKAAQRMTESIQGALSQFEASNLISPLLSSVPTEAQTLHRLLGIPRHGIHTKANASQPLPCDLLIVDEASMIDTAMLTRLLRGLRPEAKLILLGDADQLPSVESGSILADIVEGDGHGYSDLARDTLASLCPHLPAIDDDSRGRERLFHTTLQKSRRFSGQLGQAATAIKRGDIEALRMASDIAIGASSVAPSEGVVYQTVAPDNEYIRAAARTWFSGVSSATSPQQALSLLSERRWLAATRRGITGVESLNNLVEASLGVSPTAAGHYPGRPIMVTENFYPQRLFNGDIGIVWPDEQGKLTAWFEQGDGQLRAVSLSRLPRVETVFAMTVHKSQGSEFGHVLLFLPVAPSHSQRQLCTRELLYTGLTRAKKGCVLVGENSELSHMLSRRVERQTGLTQRLLQGLTAEPS